MKLYQNLNVTGSLVLSGSMSLVGANNHSFTGSVFVSGSMGIGTTAISNSTLLVRGAHASGNSIFGVIPVGNDTATIGLYNASGVRKGLFYSDTNFVRVETDSDVLQLAPVGAVTMTLSGSRVGIGISSPNTILDVVGSGGIRVNEDGTSTKVISIRSNFAGVDPAINVSSNNSLLLMTNNTERIRISAGGNVGIGTSNPGFTLHVLSTGASMGLFSTTSATGGFVGFRYNTSTTVGYVGNGNQLVTGGGVGDISLTAESGNILFATNAGAERMRIVSGGNVLIGSTSDGGEKLQVIGITRTTEGYRQDTGTVSINHNAATTIYSISGVRGLYIIYVSLPAGDAAAVNYSAYAIVSFDSSAARILQQTDGSNLFITLSGNNIQARQTSGNPQNVVYRLIKII